MMGAFFRRLRARLKYWNNAEELKKELEAHQDLAAASFAAGGDSSREARWKAARLLGNTTIAREDARAVWVARWIEQLLQDTRYALRTMRREWGFTLTASITLTLGIGVLLGVFSVFNGMFLRPWPVRAAHEVFGVTTGLADPADTGKELPARISYVVWSQIRQDMTTANLAAKFDHLTTLRTTAEGRGRGGRYAIVDPDFLETVGVDLQLGTLPTGGSSPAIAITDAVWRNVFGANPSVVGRQAWLDAHPVVISGVLEPKFAGFPSRVYDGIVVLSGQTSTWLSEGLSKAPDILVNPKACCIEVIGRLRPGATLDRAAQEIESRTNSAQAAFGLPLLKVTTWHTAMADRPGGVKSTVRTLFGLLFAGCAIVTILACANIGNLQLARGLRRSREIAVRQSLGASRSRVVRQLLTESAAITIMGTAGGLLLAWALPPLVMSFEGSSSTDYSLDATVFAFGVSIAGLTTLLSGLAPALRVTRIEWRGAASGVSAGSGQLRGVLLAVQIALSLSLIASASLLSRGALRAADGAGAGFEVNGIYSYRIATLSNAMGENTAARDALRTTIASDPALALGDAVPWQRSQPYFQVLVPGRTEMIVAQNAGFNQAAISLLRLPLLTGRWPQDDWRLNEATISRSLALALWQSDDVVGKTFSTNHPFRGKAQYSVVGVMDEVRLRDATPVPAVITALRAEFLPVIFGPPGIETEVKALVARADPSLLVLASPLTAELRRNMEGTFIGISVASGLGLVALLLASLGVFGVFAYIVEERRREIGVRLALGATRSQVRRSIVAATRWPVTIGLAAGLGLAITGGVVLRSNLYGLSILDPLSYLVVAGILAAAAMIATYIPMRRATRVDPAVTLRAD
jgi:predicted permease